jgi:hypothetical protein
MLSGYYRRFVYTRIIFCLTPFLVPILGQGDCHRDIYVSCGNILGHGSFHSNHTVLTIQDIPFKV